jgi:hypothetical protein
MTEQLIAKQFKPIFQIVLWLLVTAVAVLAVKIVDIFFPEPFGAHIPLYFWLYPLFLFGLVVRVVPVVPGVFALAFLFGTTLSGVYFEFTLPVEAAKLSAFRSRYESCKRSAVPVGDGKALAICENHDRIGYFDAIVYDSSDEISLPSEKRSPAWWEAATHQKNDASFEQFEFEAKQIEPHFYYVTFYISSAPPRTRFNGH